VNSVKKKWYIWIFIPLVHVNHFSMLHNSAEELRTVMKDKM